MSERQNQHELDDNVMEYNTMKCKYCNKEHGTVTDHTPGYKERSVLMCDCQRKYFIHMIKQDYEKGCFKRVKNFEQLTRKLNELYS